MSKLPNTFVPGFHDEIQVQKMKYNILGKTGLEVSHLSIGTGGFCYFYGNYTVEECKATIYNAIKSGINYIDTGPWYGHGESEKILGECLEGIPRQAYYIGTKVGRYEKDPKLMFDFSASRTAQSINESLKRLRLDYVDVIQVHDIEFAPSLDYLLKETLPVLIDSVESGKAKFIGITGYPVSTLAEFSRLSEIISVIFSYSRLSLVDSTLLDFMPYFQCEKFGVINAAPHLMGLLTNDGPQQWHPAPSELKDICSLASQYCKKNNIELGKLAVYYAFQQAGPHTHMVGMNNCAVLKSNLGVLFDGLTQEEEVALKYLQTEFFTRLRKTHWEGIEIEQRKEMLCIS